MKRQLIYEGPNVFFGSQHTFTEWDRATSWLTLELFSYVHLKLECSLAFCAISCVLSVSGYS